MKRNVQTFATNYSESKINRTQHTCSLFSCAMLWEPCTMYYISKKAKLLRNCFKLNIPSPTYNLMHAVIFIPYSVESQRLKLPKKRQDHKPLIEFYRFSVKSSFFSCFLHLFLNVIMNNFFNFKLSYTKYFEMLKQWRSKFWGPKMCDFGRERVLCLGQRFSKHKMTGYAKYWGAWPLGPRGYAYVSKVLHLSILICVPCTQRKWRNSRNTNIHMQWIFFPH